MAIISKVKSSTNANNTKPYIIHVGEDSVYGIIINARDTISLRAKDGTMRKFEMTPELLLRILNNGVTSVSVLEDIDNSGSQSDLAF